MVLKSKLKTILSHVFGDDSPMYEKIEAVFENEYRRLVEEKVSERLAENYSRARGDHELEYDEQKQRFVDDLREVLPAKCKAGSITWAVKTVISRHTKSQPF